MEKAELSEKSVDEESQPQQRALESPFLVSSLEAFYHVSWKEMGRRQKELNTGLPGYSCAFPLHSTDQGKGFISGHIIVRSEGWKCSVSRAAVT